MPAPADISCSLGDNNLLVRRATARVLPTIYLLQAYTLIVPDMNDRHCRFSRYNENYCFPSFISNVPIQNFAPPRTRITSFSEGLRYLDRYLQTVYCQLPQERFLLGRLFKISFFAIFYEVYMLRKFYDVTL